MTGVRTPMMRLAERITSLDVPMPYARNLEELVLPSPARVIAAVRRLFGAEETPYPRRARSAADR